MPELSDLMNELPEGLQEGAQVDDPSTNTESDESIDDTDVSTDDNNQVSDDDNTDADTSDDVDTEDNVDDYIIKQADEEIEEESPVAKEIPRAVTGSEQDQYIISKLLPITVRIVTADDKVETLQVYGEGQLPNDFKGFATKKEEILFNKAVLLQENRAIDARNEYQRNQQQIEQQKYEQLENQAIRDDLTELRQDGVFPKFKGEPGTKEFNNSDGAKEFDRVVNYMNEYNDKALQASQRGKAYRHIGFREAFTMLNGADPKAADRREQQSRKAVASRLGSGRGTNANSRKPLPPVSDLRDLQIEWDQLVGNAQ